MGQQDLYQSDFYEDKGRFADVFNAVLFQGKEVMKPEELETEDSVLTQILGEGQGKKVICDKIRRWKGGYAAICVLENQTSIDYGMVLRVMQSEVMGYEKQRKEQYEKNKRQRHRYRGAEYISRVKKGQKFVPIITVLLYFGKERPWDGAKSLHDLLDMEEEIKPFVNDFKLNLFDYHEDKDFGRFKTENRLLFEMLSCEKDKEKMKEVLEKHAKDGKVDEDSAKAILGILKVKLDLEKIMKKDEEGKEVYDMCQAFEDYKEEGRQAGLEEGRIEGRLSGLEEGKSEGEISALKEAVIHLMGNLKISFEEAAKMIGISGEKQKKLSQLI